MNIGTVQRFLYSLLLLILLSHCNPRESEEYTKIPFVREVWQNWIQNNNYPINSLSSENFDDLIFLKKILQPKTIVAMGELAHGVAEQNRLRVRIIKYLHQELDFTTIAFESGLFECYFMNQDLEKTNSLTALKNSLHSFWRTADLVDLIDYVKKSRNTNKPINIVGFDNMFTGDLQRKRPDFFKKILDKIDKDFADEIYDLELKLVSYDYTTQLNYMRDNYEYLISIYDKLINLIQVNFSSLVNSFGKSQAEIAKRVAQGTKALVEVRNDVLIPSSLGDASARDYQMYQNIEWLATELFPNQKMVVWAHNLHVKKACRKINSDGGTPIYNVMMGDLLDYHFKNKYFNMISLSFEGKIRLSAKIQELFFTDDECIESIVNSSNRDICLIDLSSQTYQEGNSWMFEEVSQTYWHSQSIYKIFYIPHKQYDAVLFIKKVTPTIFL